jgi:hypothetical protein
MSDFWYAMLFAMFYIPFLFLWAFTLVDLFHRHDVGGFGKALWAIGILFVPIIGMLIYFLARPKDADLEAEKMMYRSGPDYAPSYTQPPLTDVASLPPTATAQAMSETDLQATAMSSPSPGVQDIETLDRLRADGTLTEDEYNRLRAQLRPA